MKKELVKTNGQEETVRPRVDVFENDAELLVVADVPGSAKDALEVRFDDGNLTIEARRAPRAGATPVAQEFRPVSYRCGFSVPDGIDAEKIDAKLDAGVLTVRLPKVAAKRARRIEVRTA